MENKRDSSPKTVSPSESLQKTDGCLGSLHTLDHSFIWKDAVGLTTKELSKSVGSERIYVNLDIIPPGAYSTKYHSHSYQEEFFIFCPEPARFASMMKLILSRLRISWPNRRGETSPTPSTIPVMKIYAFWISELQTRRTRVTTRTSACTCIKQTENPGPTTSIPWTQAGPPSQINQAMI